MGERSMVGGERRRRRWIGGWPMAVLLAALLLLPPGPASACLVCITLPERTIADRLIGADAAVLAREDPARPFTYTPVERLAGALPDEAIPYLVDSTTRRKLAADPDAGVLLVHEAGQWAQLAFVDAPVRAMLDEILGAAPRWRGEAASADRFAYFAELHDHPNETIRLLALAEISRAPYAQIRGMKPRFDRPAIARLLRDPQWAEWAPIHILFLGLSDDPGDHDFVRRMTELAAAKGIRSHLGAWATALVEIEGEPGLGWLRATYLAAPDRTLEELRAVVDALATLADGGDPRLRPSIAAAFRDLARDRPELAAEAAWYLATLEDWSQEATFTALLESGRVADPAAELAVTLYLWSARAALDASGDGSPN